MTESQARASGRKVLIGKRLMKRVGRATECSETDGFIKTLVDADTKEILGAGILGINGDEALHGHLLGGLHSPDRFRADPNDASEPGVARLAVEMPTLCELTA